MKLYIKVTFPAMLTSYRCFEGLISTYLPPLFFEGMWLTTQLSTGI